jgi:hypothetical protein
MRWPPRHRRTRVEIDAPDRADPIEVRSLAATPVRLTLPMTAAAQQLPFFDWPGGQNPGEVAIAGTTTFALGGSMVAVQADSSAKARSVARICRMVETPLARDLVLGRGCPNGPRSAGAYICRSSIKAA